MSDNNENYFNLTTEGVGFINRFRLNEPTQGNPYYSVTIAALRGKADANGKTQKTYIDCNIVGSAVEMAKQLEPLFVGEESPTVMAKFVTGDLELRPFIYNSGQKQGEQGFSLKARLYDIKWFKVNGDVTYNEAEQKRHVEDQGKGNEADEAPAPNSEAPADSLPKQTDDQSDLPLEVKLVQDDPYFDERRAQLKEQGYRWNGAKELWCLQISA